MKAVLINGDKSLSWSDVPDISASPDEALVRVEYAGINRADLMQRSGGYPPPPGAPEWMGLEISGTIEKLGDEAKEKCAFREGDRVCALLGGGGYAEYAAVRYDMLMPIPDGFSMAEAAAFPEAVCTAYLNLFIEGQAKEGETFLMQAGGSGLASVAIPLAKAFGLRVITTIRGESKLDKVKRLGADVIIDTRKEDLADALKADLERGTPVDIAVDCVGGEGMGRCLPYLAKGARWIMIAALAGTETEIDLRNIYVRNIRIIGSTLRSRAPGFKAALVSEIISKVYPKLSEGMDKPVIYKILPVTEAEAAHAILENNENAGKVVLKIG